MCERRGGITLWEGGDNPMWGGGGEEGITLCGEEGERRG